MHRITKISSRRCPRHVILPRLYPVTLLRSVTQNNTSLDVVTIWPRGCYIAKRYDLRFYTICLLNVKHPCMNNGAVTSLEQLLTSSAALPNLTRRERQEHRSPLEQSQQPFLRPLTSPTMRRTLRQLAAVKPARYLEAGAPTGLTGLFTHPAPRPALLYLYSSTLDKLKQFPESSLYRQSTEALTNHRLSIVSSVEPEGYTQWVEKAKKLLKEHPEVFHTPEGEVEHDGGRHIKETKDGRSFVVTKVDVEYDDTKDEWDGEEGEPELEGTRTTEERKGQSVLGMKRPGQDTKQIKWEPEPQLTADQYASQCAIPVRVLLTRC
jgi:NADH dehydrogenase (ubiquinone) 1 alpha subcomplex subunit 5